MRWSSWVGGHVGQHEAHDLGGVEVLGHLDRVRHRHAALNLALSILIIGKLLTYRDRWNPR
jgi:hypothetical protein